MAWKFFTFAMTWTPAFAALSLIDWARRKPIRWRWNLSVALVVATANQAIFYHPTARLLLLSFFAGSLGGWTAQIRQIKKGTRGHINPYMMIFSGLCAVTFVYVVTRYFTV